MTNGIISTFKLDANEMPNGIKSAALALFVKKFVIKETVKNSIERIIAGLESGKLFSILNAPYSARPVASIAWLKASIETIVKKTCLLREFIALSALKTLEASIAAAPIIAAATLGIIPVAIVITVNKKIARDLLANFFLGKRDEVWSSNKTSG